MHMEPQLSTKRTSAHPTVAYTPLHCDLLAAVKAGTVALHPDEYHLIAGFRVHASVELGLFRLAVADHTELGPEPDGQGNLPVLCTPLGEGVLRRWNTQQGRTGGAL